MVDDDGRTPDHGHPISSPCEPNGSGELITHSKEKIFLFLHDQLRNTYSFKCFPIELILNKHEMYTSDATQMLCNNFVNSDQ